MPTRNKIRGTKETIKQETLGDRPKSYQNTFFKVSPRVIKEVKQQITPNIKPNLKIPFPTCPIKPESASLEVLIPEAPKIIKIKKR